jgi:multidrug efflux pump subunit AcrB
MNAIHKENRQYIRVVGFDYYGSGKFGSKYLKEVLAEMENELPLGYEAKKTGWQWDWQKTKRNYALLIILAIGIYFICSVLFESLKQPLYIIGMVPLSFIGLFLTFAVFDFYFDQGGYAAFILLGGLTVNAAIFIVYDLNNLKTGNYNRNVVKAVLGKAKPILLTIASTCFGLIPFLLEGQNEVFWFSLAAGTIGGLLISLLAVFFVLPVWLMRK